MRKVALLIAAGAFLAACDGGTYTTEAAPDTRFGPDSPAMLVTTSGVWADFVIDSDQGLRYDGSCVTEIRSDPTNALLEPDYSPGDTDVGDWFSLGIVTTNTDACDRADSRDGYIEVGFGTEADPLMVGGELVMVAEATADRDGYPTESALVEGRNDGTWYELGTVDNHASDGVASIALGSGSMCYDAIRVTNTTTMDDYAGLPDHHFATGSNLMPDGFDVDAIGASQICEVEEEGCTLTQGYWKTHDDWPESTAFSYDDFFGTGYTWSEVLWLSPGRDGKDGGALTQDEIILAHQWIAATLSVESGASIPSDVEDVWNDAYDYFDGTYVGDADLTGWAEILDEYNNGILGPGHCDEFEEYDDD